LQGLFFALNPVSGFAGCANQSFSDWIPHPFPSDDLTDQIALLDDFARVECPVVVYVFLIFHTISIGTIHKKNEKNRSAIENLFYEKA